MTDKTISVKMDEGDITRISIFLENANQKFKYSSIIKNYEEFNLFLFIKRNMIDGIGTKFKDLQGFSSKSDVYMSNFLKYSVSNGSLLVVPSESDKRNNIYLLSEESDKVIREFAIKSKNIWGLSWKSNLYY